MSHKLPWRLTCLILLALPFSMPQAGQAAPTETLTLCLEKSDVRPWRTQEGGGLNIDLLNQVAARLNLHFDYQGMPWKRCLAELKANRVNGAIGASFKPDRLEFGVYPGGDSPDATKRLNNDRYILVRRKDNPVSWDGHAFSKLDGPVGTQLGYSVADPLRALGVKVDEGAQKAVELAQKVVARRVVAAAMLDGEARAVLGQNPKLAAQLEILPIPLLEKPYFLMFSHAMADKRSALLKRVWDEVEAVRNSPEYRTLEKEALAASHH